MGFEELNAKVLGISVDPVRSQAHFHKEKELNFPLLSDPDGSAARKYGVLFKQTFAKRVTFLIDPRGILRHVDDGVQVASHGEDVLEVLYELQED